MTSNPEDNDKPKGQKFNAQLWRYIGENPPENKGLFYTPLKSPYQKGDEWQQPDGEEFFMMTIRDDLQPPPFRHLLEKHGGFLWQGNKRLFDKEFEKCGKKD